MPRKPAGARKSAADPALPKYSIAVASDLSGVSQQQLRRMEEGGLVAPGRTDGNTRRYSDDDITQIAEISNLSSEGINAAGIRYIVQLEAELRALRAENAALREQLAARAADAPTPSPAQKANRASRA
jgi:DNA-binding transcriptional MerR regulator